MKILILLFLLIVSAFQLSAQELGIDSLKIRKIAVADADQRFKIKKYIRQAYRQKRLHSTSDYFKPNLQTVSDPKLLNDSNYVKVFRYTAFESTVDQIKLNRTKIVIAGVVVAGIAAVVIVIVKLVDAFASALTDGITNSVK